MCVYISLCVCVLSAITHNLEGTQKICGLDFKKKNGRLRKLALDLSMMKKMATESKAKGRKLNPYATCMANSCQGKTGVLFRLYSIHQHALALDVIQVLDGSNYFLSC